MICPKCKTKVSPQDTTCPNCKLRLIFKCPRCHEPARLGSINCKKCGYTFVKFCPECHSANYASSSICRRCGHTFESESIEEKTKESIKVKIVQDEPIKNEAQKIAQEAKKTIKLESNQKAKDVNIEIEKTTNKLEKPDPNKPFLIYIDFLNLDKTFEKYEKEEFKQKVIQNIKTTIKITFGTTCDFIDSHTVLFKYQHNKNVKIIEKIDQFNEEFKKFNQILEKTLDCGISYKFAISTIDEVRNSKTVSQLKFGLDKDIIVSSGAYVRLNGELSLIRISSDCYKMVYLEQKPVFEEKKDENYDKALEIILSNLVETDSKIRAISVNAPRGVGKTHLLNDVYSRIDKSLDSNRIVFYAQCSALTQISAYGLIQSFFCDILNASMVLKEEFNIKTFEKKVLNILKMDKISEEHLETLANLIYPLKKDYFENILINKEITFKYLKDIFVEIKKNKEVIFIVDDFDLIDESSYGFLKYLVDENYFKDNAKMVLGYKNQHSIAIYFQSATLTNEQCLNISLRKQNASESKIFIKKVLGDSCEIPDEILSQIAYNAQGNIAYIEQILQYLFEAKCLYVEEQKVKFKKDLIDIEIPSTLDNCFVERLGILKKQNEKEYIFLNMASLLGDKLDYYILANLFNLNEDEFFAIVEKLEKKGYLKRKVDNIYGFKNSLTWSYCYIKAKEEELIKDNAKKLLLELNNKTISTPLICPILAQIVDNKELAYSLWTKNLQAASFIGDVNIYAMAQKQSLILLENVKLENFDYVKNNICERLGKLIYVKNPQEAKDYLSNVIVEAQKYNDRNKIIDLSGYLVKSSYLTQDFNAVVEVVDNTLKYFKGDKKQNSELQVALIKTRKLEALLKLGHWEEIASIVNTEINPILQKNLRFFSKSKWISQNEIFFSWIESNIILAQSYAQQGSPLSIELINEIDKVLSKEKGQRIDILKVKLAYAEAMANLSKGYFDESEYILQDIVKDYAYIIDTPLLVCEWNIISLLNKILKMDNATIKDELFEATAYANNCNDELSKNLLKTILAYIFFEEKNYLKSIEIATEQMQYFSSKKITFGALLAWYISAAATLATRADAYCIEICEKAVKVCETIDSNNFYFKILFQELLANAYLKMNDKENAQMYCDLALQSAAVNDLQYLQLKLNNLKCTITREKVNLQPENKKSEYAQNVIKMYTKTIDMAKRLNLVQHVKKIEKELVSFRAFCQLNRIAEDK